MVRDPRDIVVSYYYSILKSHPISPNKEIAEIQLYHRKLAEEVGINYFVKEMAPLVKENFSLITRVLAFSRERILLRYEDMINCFEKFSKKISSFIPVEEKVLEELYKQSRPNEISEIDKHKRSGKTGQYKYELNTDTQEFLNDIFENVRTVFCYE